MINQNKTNRVESTKSVFQQMGFSNLTEEHFTASEIEANLQRLFVRVCGDNPRSVDEMMVPLSIEKEDDLLLKIGFNPLDIRLKELSQISKSYDPANFKKLEVYVNNMRTNLRYGCGATFFGNTGSGKTNSMSIAFRHILREFYDDFTQTVNIGMHVVFADRLVEMVKDDNYNRNAWYCETKVFGIDDIYLYTDYRYNLLRWIVNERTSKGAGYLTLMTSRLEKNEFERCRDVYSRMGLGEKFWTLGKDFREPL